MKTFMIILSVVLVINTMAAQNANNRFTDVYDFYNKVIVGTPVKFNTKFIMPNFYSMDCPSNRSLDNALNKKDEVLFKLDKKNLEGYGIRVIRVRSKIYSLASYTRNFDDYSYGEIYYNLGPEFEVVTENERFLVKKNRVQRVYLMFAKVKGFDHLFFIANISSELIENEKLYNEFKSHYNR